MSIMDTFYIMYRTNAKDAVKDQVTLKKSTDETKKSFEDATDASDKLGASFDGLASSAASFFAAYVGFNAIKSGMVIANQQNNQLYLMSSLYRQNARDLKMLGQVAQEAGGSSQAALANIQAYTQMAMGRGAKSVDPLTWLRGVRQHAQTLPEGLQRTNYINNAGFTEPGFVNLLANGSDKDFDAALKRGYEDSNFTDADAKNANAINRDLAEVSGKLDTAFTKLNTEMEPVIKGFTSLAKSLAGSAADHPIAGAAIGLAATGTAGAGLLKAWGWVKGLFAGGAETDAIAGGAAGALGTAALLALPPAWGYAVPQTTPQWIQDWITKRLAGGSDPNGDYSLANMRGNRPHTLAASLSAGPPMSDDMAYLMSKGYSSDAAAAILSNEFHESGGDPTAVGDGGRAGGLFQWHPDRRANILKNTGIDVYNASRQQQLDAVMWEMQNGRPGFDDQHFRSLGAGAGGAYFSRYFESPANAAMQAVIRGNSALSIASQYSGDLATAGNSSSIKIDKIEVHTQATDAAGIAKDLHQEMLHQLGSVQANFDDGVAK